MTGTNIWLGNQRWPSNRSCAEFGRDVFRLAGARTDKEKAFAFYHWLTRCMMRGQTLWSQNNAGGYSSSFDPLLVFTSWGTGFCSYWGWIATACLNGAGLKTRRIVAFNNAHTFYEVWYRGDDGREQWHAFDPFLGWYFMNRHGEVASCEELGADPQLVQDPLPGHAEPLGHHPDRAHLGHLQRAGEFLIIEQPLRDESNQWSLARGMNATFNFMPSAPEHALFVDRGLGENPAGMLKQGTHCWIPEIGRNGRQLHPEHLPYWRNYLWATPETDGINEGRPVRWHGSGALRWKPLNYGLAAACETHQVRIENGQMKTTGSRHFGEAWYHFKLPYLITHLIVDYDVVGDGGDYWGLTLSADDRRSQFPMKLKSHAPGFGFAHNGQAEWKAQQPSVQGLREFWLRVDLFSNSAEPRLAVRGLNVTVGFQHNMHLQPRLLPGANPLWLEAGALDPGVRLRSEWIYTQGRREQSVLLELDRAGRAERTVEVAAESPEDIVMTGIRMECL
ncbi:MAG TPA: hypothetical protein VL860_01085 [Planctomycetota bacterium]|nr:hypothetical protein [Planctomycetota bacterium]